LQFERNQAKDYEDAAKNPALGKNQQSRFTDQTRLDTYEKQHLYIITLTG